MDQLYGIERWWRMQATFQTKIRDEGVYPLLDAIAVLYGHLMRRLFVDLYVRDRKLSECKKLYIARHGLTARQFNAIAFELNGKVRAVREARKQRMATLEDQIAATEKAIRRLQREDKALASGRVQDLKPHERAVRRWRVRFCLHQKKRRLSMLRARLLAEQQHQGPPSICFGSRKLFCAQFHLAENGFASHADWLRAWREARASAFFCLGSKDETGGNQTCTLLPDGTLRLRVSHALVGQYGTHVVISGIRFPYGQEVIDAALSAGQAISYRFVRKDCVWYLFATTERPRAEWVTSRVAGALGVDLNPDRVAVGEVDRFGNPLCVRDIPIQVQGRRKEQVLSALGDAVADIATWARTSGKPVVVERLDFRAKKARLRDVSDRHARKLSHFAYAAFHALLVSRAAREGVEVIEVNPAYTSVMGKVKFMARYGLSPHGSAAVAIARRGLGFGGRLRSGNARPLPARNRGRHVWSDWGRVLPSVRGRKQTHALYQRPSEGGSGRGIPLSVSAPASGGSHGPGRDGLAWVPGCDPPARIVGSTVRPAS
jgi:IS605 OrfB family transposase